MGCKTKFISCPPKYISVKIPELLGILKRSFKRYGIPIWDNNGSCKVKIIIINARWNSQLSKEEMKRVKWSNKRINEITERKGKENIVLQRILRSNLVLVTKAIGGQMTKVFLAWNVAMTNCCLVRCRLIWCSCPFSWSTSSSGSRPAYSA